MFQALGVNFLVLDEPTNHLDLPAIEQLESALAGFGGTLLLVSHDRQLLESVELTRTSPLAGLVAPPHGSAGSGDRAPVAHGRHGGRRTAAGWQVGQDGAWPRSRPDRPLDRLGGR